MKPWPPTSSASTWSTPREIAALKAYYATKPEPYKAYLNDAADGINPFVYIDGFTVSLVDAAQHDLVPQDVPMVVPDDFPLGTYTVEGKIKDLAGNETTVTLILVVTGDRVAPVLTITGATADGIGMEGSLETGYILETTNDPAINHLLQFAAGTAANEELQAAYFGLYLVDSTVTAADLKAYYADKPEPYLSYLNDAADGLEPFVYIDGFTVSLVDAAQHDLVPQDVPMVVPDDFPLGTYTVEGKIKDLAGNETTVTLILIINDITMPTLESVDPAEGPVVLNATDTFVWTVDAEDLGDNLYSLEIDHSMEGTLPEFTVYASETNPYGTPEAQAEFAAIGASVSYDAATDTWTIDFGETVTNMFVSNGGITFYIVIKDDVGNQWGTMFGTTPENTIIYSITREDTIPFLESVDPAEGPVVLNATDTFVWTVDAEDLGDNLYELEIDHNMSSSLPEFSVYASETDPYGGEEATFASAGVTVTYDATTETWVIDFGDTITDAFVANGGITFYIVIKDDVGNQWGTMYGTTPENTFIYSITREDTMPTLESVDPAEGPVALNATDTFVWTVDAEDLGDNLYELEIDHNMSSSLPEFSVYASETDPYGGEEATFASAGVTVTYAATTETWVIDFGDTITDAFVANGGITFYIVIKDDVGNQWGTMYGTTPENTFIYSINYIPEADDQNITTDEDTAIAITLTATDKLGTVSTWIIGEEPTYGNLSGTAPDLTYTPFANYHGSDYFTFKVNDGADDLNIATISITINSVNDNPVAVDDYYETNQDVTLVVAAPGILGNDSDQDMSDNSYVTLNTPAQHGNIQLLGDGSFVYTSEKGFFGEDFFTYTMISYPTREPYSDTATVFITVHPLMEYFLPLILR